MVSVQIMTHLFADNGYLELEAVRNRKNNEMNPFMIGEMGISDYYNNLRKKIETAIANHEEK